MRPVYLAGGVAVLLDAPLAAPTGLAVLLVPPFGWDEQSTYRARRTWARALAAEGHTALRVDLPGTGDSAGAARDPDLAAAWTAAVADAIAWLRGTPGISRVAVIALGLGGLLTLAAGGADELILWGVPARGRNLLREVKAFGRLELSQTGEKPGEIPEGELRAGGHVLTAETAAAVGGLDAAELLRGGAPRRALVLGRDGVEPDAALVAALTAAGAAVEAGDGEGWGAAMAGPQYALPPHAAIARTVWWLASVPMPAAIADPPAPADAPDGLELEVGGARVRETALTFEAAGADLFGVLAEPLDRPGGPGTAVLLNAGAIRHIGPNRMAVEAARRWAAAGIPTLRLDLRSIGEADGADEPYDADAGFYVPELTEQALAALDELAARGLPPRFFLTGLCSGSYWALHAGLADERVRGMLLLNPKVFFWDEDIGPRRELRRALSVLTPAGFRALLRAERPRARLLELLRWLLRSALHRRRPSRPPTADDRLAQAVQRLQSRGQRLELAFSGNEPLHDELVRDGELGMLAETGVMVHPLPYRSHTLKPLGAQRAAHSVLDDALRRSFDQ